jgi:general secretion pathway protein G
MKLRCPYCKELFEALDSSRCPACGKGLRIAREKLPDIPGHKPLRMERILRTHRLPPGTDKPSPFMIPLLVFTTRPRFLLTAITVLGLAVCFVMTRKVNTNTVSVSPRIGQTQKELQVLRTALEWFRADCRRYPSTAEGLRALVRDPGVPGWAGFYIEELPRDVWKPPFRYACTNESIALFSSGPDGLEGNADDVPSPGPDWKELVERVDVSRLPRWAGEQTNVPPAADSPR